MDDINQTFNDIIIKYGLDEYYPNFQKRLQAEKIMGDFFRGKKGRMAFIAAFASDFYHIRHFVRDGLQAEYFLCERVRDYTKSYEEAFSVRKLADVDWSKYDEIMVVSLEGSSFLKHWLRTHGIRYIFLYDLFERNGVVFDKEWDSILPDPAMEWWTYYDGDPPKQNYIMMELSEQLREYQTAQDEADKRLHLHKTYFLALYIKDFILAAQCVAWLGENTSRQAASWREIEDFLAAIKKKLADRETKDILVLWTDAMPYEDISWVPFLAEKMRDGVCFDNIFTVCPYTNPTLKAILCGKMPVDENTYAIKAITEENSPVYQILKQYGYTRRVIGDWLSIRPEDSSSLCHIPYEPATLGLWDLWRNLLLSEGPIFCLVHNLEETHMPHLSPLISDSDMDHAYSRFEKSCAWLSEQYAYYLSPLPQKMLKFYLTDHGKSLYKNRFHTYLVVEGEAIQPRRIGSLCSFVDFHRLFRQLLETNEVDEEKLRRDYVEVQDLDFYHAGHSARLIADKREIDAYFFGYHGIVTDEYIYLHFNDGREWFVRRGTYVPEPNLFGSYICDASKIEPFRRIVQAKEKDVPSFKEKLKYSRYVHQVFIRAKARNQRKKALLNEWLRPYPPGSVLIRTGGVYALQVYGLLSPEIRRCIGGFIDVNLNCLGAEMGLPVYAALADAPATTQAVLLAGRRTLIERLREEAAACEGQAEILDPYRFLEEHGIICRHGVGEFEAEAEDYDVGFPFDEVVAY